MPDFWDQGHFFFKTPDITESAAIKDKWSDTKKAFFESWVNGFDSITSWTHDALEAGFNEQMTTHNLKKGDVLLPLRIMLVGAKFGPGVFDIAALIGKEETAKRIANAIRVVEG